MRMRTKFSRGTNHRDHHLAWHIKGLDEHMLARLEAHGMVCEQMSELIEACVSHKRSFVEECRERVKILAAHRPRERAPRARLASIARDHRRSDPPAIAALRYALCS